MIRINLNFVDEDFESIWNIEIENLSIIIKNLLENNNYTLSLLEYEFLNLKKYIYEGNEYLI